MHVSRYLTFSFVLLVLLAGCKKDYAGQISTLEQRLEQGYNPALADSLINLYLEAAKAAPENHAQNLEYATKAASVRFLNGGHAKEPVRWLNEALAKHSEGANLTETIGVLSQIWNAYRYKAATAVNMDPDDIDQMHANLLKNMAWMDSSLIRLDRKMIHPQTGAINKNQAATYIEIAEAEADVLQELNQTNAYVDIVLKAAGVAKTAGNPAKALQLYYKIESRYPSHPKAPTALFMSGFIYENDLNELDKAKAAYEDFLERYPDDPDYADDAQNALKLLGKSPEEVVREFEKKGK